MGGWFLSRRDSTIARHEVPAPAQGLPWVPRHFVRWLRSAYPSGTKAILLEAIAVSRRWRRDGVKIRKS